MKRIFRRSSRDPNQSGYNVDARRASLQDTDEWKSQYLRRASLPVHDLPTRKRSTSTLASSAPGVVVDDWQPDARPVRSSLPHIGFSARNDDWNSVQQAVLAMFRREALETNNLVILEARAESLAKSDIGPFIYDYYKNQLLRKGMGQMRDGIAKSISNGNSELESLGEAWDYFYKEILPSLHFLLHRISVKDLTVKQATLVEFRDNVLLRFDVADWLHKRGNDIVPPSIQQMFLVLQSVPLKDPPGEKYLQLESLIALVVVPYLGYRGLYRGKSEPSIIAKRTDPSRRLPLGPVMGRAGSMIIPAITVDTSAFDLSNRKGSQPSMLSSMASLTPVVEVDPRGLGVSCPGARVLENRRHSFTVL